MVYTLFLRGLQLLARAKVRRVVFGFRRKIIMHTLSHAANNARTDLSPDFLRGPRSEFYLFSLRSLPPQQFVQVSILPAQHLFTYAWRSKSDFLDAKPFKFKCSPLGAANAHTIRCENGKVLSSTPLSEKGQDSRLSLLS